MIPSMNYTRDDFVEAIWTGTEGSVYYCPGCNKTVEDATFPSVNCPCGLFGSGDGAINAEGVELYLASISNPHE